MKTKTARAAFGLFPLACLSRPFPGPLLNFGTRTRFYIPLFACVQYAAILAAVFLPVRRSDGEDPRAGVGPRISDREPFRLMAAAAGADPVTRTATGRPGDGDGGSIYQVNGIQHGSPVQISCFCGDHWRRSGGRCRHGRTGPREGTTFGRRGVLVATVAVMATVTTF